MWYQHMSNSCLTIQPNFCSLANAIKLMQTQSFITQRSHIHTHPSVWLTISNQSWGINQLDCTYFSVCLSWTKYLSTYLVLSHLNTWLFCVHCWIYSIISIVIFFYISTNDNGSSVLFQIHDEWTGVLDTNLHFLSFPYWSDQHSLKHTNWQLAEYRLNTCITIMTDLHHTKTLPSSQIGATNWVECVCQSSEKSFSIVLQALRLTLVRKLQVLLQQEVQVHTYLTLPP